jgi:FMN phosphatase YigB (HAD superfamily)
MTTPTIQALLFDLGGVLIDIDFNRSLRLWADNSSLSFEQLREAFRQDVYYQRHEIGDISGKEYFDSLRASLKLDGSDEQIAAGWNAMLVSGIGETLMTVRKARKTYPCYLFTNSNPTHQAVWQSRFPDIVAAFDRVFVSSEIGLRKPSRAAFEFIAREIGVAAESILFFDDTLENVTGALAAGLQAVHVKGPVDVHNALRQLGCVP